MKIKKIIGCMLLFFLILLPLGCKKNETNSENPDGKSFIKIPIVLTVDPSTGQRNEEDIILEFNERYKGVYYADVTWVVETETEYRENMKRQNVTDTLPVILQDVSTVPSFYQMMLHENRLEPLMQYINEDEEWRNQIGTDMIVRSKEADGEVYLGPVGTSAFACSGIYWNKELFEKAGIKKFPTTWDDFYQCCEQLEKSGITPLALHTDGTAWAPMLLATAEVSSLKGGDTFLRQRFPDNYDNIYGRQLVSSLKRLMSYTTEDAYYNDFDIAYKNFVEGNAAMLPNGYWMMDQIPEDMVDKVGFATFPENTLIASPETFGWGIVEYYDEDVKKGAVELLKLRTAMYKEKESQMFEEAEQKDNILLKEYVSAYQNAEYVIPNYQVKWYSSLQEKVIEECLPELMMGTITEQDFIDQMNECVKEYQ